MNSTKTSCHKTTYSASPYFRYNLRHNWYQLAIYIVVAILTMILPCVIEVSKRPLKSQSYSYDNFMMTIGTVGFILSGFMGLFSGMSALSYVNNKQNVICLHSFPLKRSSVFMCEAPIGFIYYVISMSVGFVSAYVITSILGLHYKNTVFIYLCTILNSVFLYLLVNSATLLAAGLTGTGVSRFLMTALILFFPMALYALVMSTVNIGFEALNLGYYINTQVIQVLCPAARLLREITNSGETYIGYLLSCLMVLPYIVAYYVGAFLLHKYRKTEATGKTIIWKPIFIITKYAVIFTAALLGILIFGSGLFTETNGTLDVIFGAIIGLVISYMVVNSILYRSTRSMFKDFKTFLALSAVVIVYVLIIPANVFGLIGGLYSESNTKSFVINVDGIKAEITDSDIASKVEEYLDYEMYGADSIIIDTPCLWSTNDDDYLREYFTDYVETEEGLKYYSDENPETERGSQIVIEEERYKYVEVVQNPKFGIPLSFNIYIPSGSDLWESILLSEDYRQKKNVSAWLEFDDIREAEVYFGDSRIYMNKDGVSIRTDVNTYNEESYSTNNKVKIAEKNLLLNKILENCMYNEDEIRNSPIVGYIIFYYEESTGEHYNGGTWSRESVAYPISVGQLNLLNSVAELIASVKDETFTPYSSAKEYYADIMKNDCEAVMVDTETGEAKRIDFNEIIAHGDETVSLKLDYNMSMWELSGYISAEDVGYIFIIANKDGYTSEIKFRRGAADRDELAELFNSLK